MASSKKLQLPKSVLQMSFMKRTRERIEKEMQNTQLHDSFYSNNTTDMRHSCGNYYSEPSYIYCEELLEGRLSFKGMNPEIERLMEQDNREENVVDEMQKDVSDDILYKKMEALNKRKNKFDNTPDKHPAKKKRFNKMNRHNNS